MKTAFAHTSINPTQFMKDRKARTNEHIKNKNNSNLRFPIVENASKFLHTKQLGAAAFNIIRMTNQPTKTVVIIVTRCIVRQSERNKLMKIEITHNAVLNNCKTLV